MTQAKSKSKSTQKKPSTSNRIYMLLDKCSDKELNELTEEIAQPLWEREKVAEALANPGPTIPAEEVFMLMYERNAEFVKKGK